MAKWIEWHGGECPLPEGTLHKIKYRNGYKSIPRRAVGFFRNAWDHNDMPFNGLDIIAYRIISPLGEVSGS